MITIKDVAKACNVSSATASRALNGVGYVEKIKKELIVKKAKEMGYIVDNYAKSLKSGKSNTIGIIVSDIGNYFYNLVLEQLIFEFKKYNFNVLLSYSFENSQFERENIKSMISSRVDALIFTPISNTNQDLIEIMKRKNIKILQLFRQAYLDIDALCVDDEYGSYLATQHLIKTGHKRILLLSVQLDFTPSRSNGYLLALKENNIELDEKYIQLFPLGHHISNDITQLIIDLNPDSIIAGTNNFGADTLIALKNLNRKITLIAFDDLQWFDILNISTISQPIEAIYHTIIDNIMGKINENSINNGVGELMFVKPNLIKRNKD